VAAIRVFSVDSFTSSTSSDYNGFCPDPEAEYSFIWKSPPTDLLKDYVGERVEHKFATLAEYSQATGQDRHSIIADCEIFEKVKQPDPNNITKVYKREDFDFRLKANTVAVDTGCRLSNINDDFSGKAPDLGALELGQAVPVYGPRPQSSG
jgi:hypothetical protein